VDLAGLERALHLPARKGEACDKQYCEFDIPPCREIAKKQEPEVGKRCDASATKRYAASLKGEELDQLLPILGPSPRGGGGGIHDRAGCLPK
jgi:hypothetical protein